MKKLILFLLLLNQSVFASSDLEVVARLEQAVGNITFTPDNRIIFSHHPFFSPEIRVAELLKDGSIRSFPNDDWAKKLDNVLGLRGDKDGIVWIMDTGTRSNKVPKLIAWDTKKDKLHKVIYVPEPASLATSFHNDFVIIPKSNVIVIADEGIGPNGDGSQAGLIIVDLVTGLSRRVLDNHKSVIPENVPVKIGEQTLRINGKELRVGADGITADKNYEWLYYGPMNGKSLYRIKISDLLNASLSKENLESKVERYASKPINGGLSIDSAGNIYLTEMETNSIGLIDTSRKHHTLYSSPDLLWPDGVSYSPDGYMYVSGAQLHLAGAFNNGRGKNKFPYYIFRFKPKAKGIIGL